MKRIVRLDGTEFHEVITAVCEARNICINEGRYHDAHDDMLIKISKEAKKWRALKLDDYEWNVLMRFLIDRRDRLVKDDKPREIINAVIMKTVNAPYTAGRRGREYENEARS